MANSYAAPNYYVDTDTTLSALETATGHTCVSGDKIYVHTLATLTVDVSRTLTQIILGNKPTGDAGANNRRGNVTFNTGLTITWDGAASAANSGITCNPTNAGTESKSCTVTIGAAVTFTNTAGGYNASNLYSCALSYGVWVNTGTLTVRYSTASAGSFFTLPISTKTTSTTHNLGKIVFTPGAVGANVTIYFAVMVTSWSVSIHYESLNVDHTGSIATTRMVVDPFYNDSNLVAGVKLSVGSYSITNVPAGKIAAYQFERVLASPGQEFNVTSMQLGSTVPVNPLAVPTGLALTNPATGGILTCTISNISAYANTDLFQLAKSDGTIVGEFTKADYVALGNLGTTWNVLTNGVSYQLKIRVTADNFTFSDYSALCTAATPTGTSPCTTPAGFALTDAATDGELTWVITNYASLEAGARLIFYDGATVLAVQPAAAAGRIAGLTNATAYTLTVCADAAGYSESTASSSSTATPTAPSTVTVSSAESFMDPNVDMDLAMFGETITYTPQGVAVRTIKAVVCRETYQDLFDTGTDTIKYERMEIVVSARNNTTGIVAPTECGKTGGGDSLVLEGKTWYVHQIPERNVAGTHRLLISTAQTPPTWS